MIIHHLTLVLSMVCLQTYCKEPPTIIILGQPGPQGSGSNSPTAVPINFASSSSSGSSRASTGFSPLSSLTSSLNLLKFGFGDRKKETKEGPHIIYIAGGPPQNRDSNLPMNEMRQFSSPLPPPPQPPSPPPLSSTATQIMPTINYQASHNQMISRNHPVYQSPPPAASSGVLAPSGYHFTPYPVSTVYQNSVPSYQDYDVPEYPSWSRWH
ncbi:uncharacterized protein LOC141850490 [Brevipalpus obovatus]|uniref:uncharacterized protein LOC141850490 n=1 Tax=Brevipalpus obovatus TaxID=246614 RepID=UPI003D9E33B1